MNGFGKRGFVAVIAVGLLVAGCAGGSGAVTAPNTPKQIAADKAVAKQAMLRLSDLPAGYKGTPHDNSSGNDLPKGVEATFIACTGLPKRFIDTKSDDQPDVEAPDFTKGTVGRGRATEIDSSVELDRSSNDIKEPLSHLTGSHAASCFKPFLRAAIERTLADSPGVTLAPVTVRVLDIGAIGDQSAAFQGRTGVSGPGGSLSFEFNFYFVRTGRAVVTMIAIGVSGPFDQPRAQSLLQTMVDRLPAAS